MRPSAIHCFTSHAIIIKCYYGFTITAYTSPVDKSRSTCFRKLPDPDNHQSIQTSVSPKRQFNTRLNKRTHRSNVEVMKLSTGTCSVKARVDCWIPMEKYKRSIYRYINLCSTIVLGWVSPSYLHCLPLLSGPANCP